MVKKQIVIQLFGFIFSLASSYAISNLVTNAQKSSNRTENQLAKSPFKRLGGIYRGFGVSLAIISLDLITQIISPLDSVVMGKMHFMFYCIDKFISNLIILSPSTLKVSNILNLLWSTPNVYKHFINYYVMESLSDSILSSIPHSKFISSLIYNLPFEALIISLIKCPFNCIQVQYTQYIAGLLSAASTDLSSSTITQNIGIIYITKDYITKNGFRGLYKGFQMVYLNTFINGLYNSKWLN